MCHPPIQQRYICIAINLVHYPSSTHIHHLVANDGPQRRWHVALVDTRKVTEVISLITTRPVQCHANSITQCNFLYILNQMQQSKFVFLVGSLKRTIRINNMHVRQQLKNQAYNTKTKYKHESVDQALPTYESQTTVVLLQ